MENNLKTWVLVGFVVLGGVFEVIKHAPTVQATAWEEVENLHLSNLLPYSIQEAGKKAVAVKMAKSILIRPTTVVAASAGPVVLPEASVIEAQLKAFMAENEQTETEFDADGNPIKKKKKKHGPDWEQVIDPETGKKVWRKKKVEETATAQTETKFEKDLAHKEDENGTPSADVQAAVNAAANGSPLPNGGATPTNHFNSLQDWQALLLTKPNLEDTTKFIQQYKQHLVTEEVFYKIVTSMISSSNVDMRSLGVMCAGETPSVASFQLLAGLDKTAAADDAARVQGDKFLDMYATELGLLAILQDVLKGGDTFSATVAAEKLDASAKTYLVAGGTTGNPGTQGTGVAHSEEFLPFEPILQGLTQSSDQTLASQATQTLSHLQSLLAGSGTPTTTASADGSQSQ